MSTSRLHELSRLGQSVWVDHLSRTALESGRLARWIEEDAVVGLTSNPSIFQAAIAEGAAYEQQLRELVRYHDDPREIFLALAVRDVADACDVLRPTWEATAHLDGYVSLEVDPGLAHDADATTVEAVRLNALIDRPNALIKIPATVAGLTAIEESVARGVPVNVTLIFSLQRHLAVAEAYIRGLERLLAAGGDPGAIASVASFFISRVDTAADQRLDALGGHAELRGKLAIANARLAYEQYHGTFAGPRWEALAAAGARPQRCLWASTSTKDPAYRDTLYIEELIAPDTVNTMPPETIRAFQDHGVVEPGLAGDAADARRVLAGFAAAGIDYDELTAQLEREGVQKFADAFDALLERVGERRRALAAA